MYSHAGLRQGEPRYFHYKQADVAYTGTHESPMHNAINKGYLGLTDITNHQPESD